VILEYEVHGKILSTGMSYDNRFISVVTIEKRKIVHWRDYMDSLAAWTALNSASLSRNPPFFLTGFDGGGKLTTDIFDCSTFYLQPIQPARFSAVRATTVNPVIAMRHE